MHSLLQNITTEYLDSADENQMLNKILERSIEKLSKFRKGKFHIYYLASTKVPNSPILIFICQNKCILSLVCQGLVLRVAREMEKYFNSRNFFSVT